MKTLSSTARRRVRLATSAATAAALVTALALSPARDQAVQAASPVPTSKPALQNAAFKNGQGGFVVTHIAYALAGDGDLGVACPKGMAHPMARPNFGGRRPDGQGNPAGAAAGARPTAGATPGTPAAGAAAPGQAAALRPGGQSQAPQGAGQSGGQPDNRPGGPRPGGPGGLGGINVCMNPEKAQPDPNYFTVTGSSMPVDGIDLDGQNSSMSKRAARNTCKHDDFRGIHGEQGIDNQYYRVVGCTTGYQPTGQANTFEIEMYSGSWGIALSLKGVDDLKNDPDVEVGIYATADPLQLSPARQALPNATYAIDQNPRFRATAHGRIVNGVLTTDPADVRFHWVVNSMMLERPLRDARLKLTFTPDGGMTGYLAGYTPVEDMYDFAYGYRNAKDRNGNPAPDRIKFNTAFGAASSLGHSCNGAYYALKEAADGHPDAGGHCTSISTQYRISVIPAFIVDVPTKSVNAAGSGR